MIFIQALFIVILVLCCLMLIGLVLLQKSKSEGLGLAFGAGAGESLFGARAGNVLSRATVVIGCVFMASALVLGMLFSQQDRTLMDGEQSDPLQPTTAQSAPIQELDIRTSETQPAASADLPFGNQGKGLDADLAAVEAGVAEAQADEAILNAQVADAEAVIAVAEGDADAAEVVAEASQADAAANASVVDALKADAKAELAAQQEAEAQK